MNNKKILLVAANELEFGGVDNLDGYAIHITGIGKISAACNLTAMIFMLNPDVVINIGSCGNLKNHKVGDVLKVDNIFNDIDCRPFADYGTTPFSQYETIELGSGSGIKCFTTDYFYDVNRTDYSQKYKEMIEQCDIVDMESYALAQVCIRLGVEFHSYKWVSDDGESNKWEENAAAGFENFKSIFRNFVKDL